MGDHLYLFPHANPLATRTQLEYDMSCQIGGENVNVPLDPNTQREEHGRNDQDFGAHFLPGVHFGLGGPVEELDDVFGHLGRCGGGAVFVLDEAVVEDAGHSDAYDGGLAVY